MQYVRGMRCRSRRPLSLRRQVLALADLDFKEPAGDRAVGEIDTVGGAEPEIAGHRRVGGENGRVPSAAGADEPVADAAEEGPGAGKREPLAVGGIGDDKPAPGRRHRLLEMLLFDGDRRRHTGGLGAQPRRFDGFWIEIARLEAARGHDDAGLEFRDESGGQVAVAIAESEKPMPLAAGPPQPRRHPRRDRRRLDDERPRPAHRIEERLARRPAGDGEDPGGEDLGERGVDFPRAPAALVERLAGSVAEDRRRVADEVERQAERRTAQLHARSSAARRAELVDDRVLDDLRRVERMIEEGVVDRRIDPERVGDLQLLAPVDLFHRGVERLGALHPETAEWLENADRRPALENGPIERLLLLSRRRREFDRPPADPQVGGADRFEFPGKDPFETLERARRHPRRLVGNRRRERAGNGMDGGKRGGHGGHEGEGGDGRKRIILPSGRRGDGRYTARSDDCRLHDSGEAPHGKPLS